MTELNETTLLQNVDEYVSVSSDWDWDKIGQYLTNDYFQLLFSVKTPDISAGLDRIAWFPNVSGEFTQKSTYNSIIERDIAR